MYYYPGFFIFPFIPFYNRGVLTPDAYNPNYYYQSQVPSTSNYRYLQRNPFQPEIATGFSPSHWKWKRDRESIIFPTWNYPYQRQQNNVGNGKLCFMPDGLTGTCVKFTECSNIHWTVLQFSQYLSQCGFVDATQEICCPVSLVNPVPLKNAEKTQTQMTFEKSDAPITTNNMAFINENVTSHEKNLTRGRPPIDLAKLSVAKNVGKASADKIKVNVGTVKLGPSNIEGYNFSSPESEQVCGLYDSTQKIWPWLVSIGYRSRINHSIEWICIGSLISKEYILTTAHCLQKSPNVILIGKLNFGIQKHITDDAIINLHPVADLLLHPKYHNHSLYNNIGLVRLSNPVKVNEKTIPVCFPFLAGVLEIIPFVGRSAKVAGYFKSLSGTYVVEEAFGYEEYRILNNTICSSLFSKQPMQSNRFPNGIQSDIMCGLTRKQSPPCMVSGAPLVIHDAPSNSFVVIGVATGDPTCMEFRRQIVTFTRINAFSSWVREQTGLLPNPAVCYF